MPKADNVEFEISGGGKIVDVDNGYQASEEPFKADYRKAFNGKCLVIVQSKGPHTIESKIKWFKFN